MAVELRQLRAFVTVVDEGTFTDAAIALRTSQASVSRSVASLERELGARLLQRTSRGVVPTVAGARVLGRARRVLDDVSAIEREVADTSGELLVGYAWSALGRHTTTLQRRWSAEHPGSTLVFVQANTTTAGLVEGAADIAVTRRPLTDRRFETALVGTERRYAALASDHPLARRRTVGMADFSGATVGIDSRTGTTTQELWPADAAPGATRETHGVDEWLTLIAAGQAIGITSEATARQHPRPGIVYRPVRDAQPVPVWLAWWRDDRPAQATALVQLASELYAGGS
ncbi:MAG TPA: LysR family transcriptional regulator [Marmoricola sp.]|nr:LysR family transcriptional regulator [Marmoricola sp.]